MLSDEGHPTIAIVSLVSASPTPLPAEQEPAGDQDSCSSKHEETPNLAIYAAGIPQSDHQKRQSSQDKANEDGFAVSHRLFSQHYLSGPSGMTPPNGRPNGFGTALVRGPRATSSSHPLSRSNWSCRPLGSEKWLIASVIGCVRVLGSLRFRLNLPAAAIDSNHRFTTSSADALPLRGVGSASRQLARPVVTDH